MAQCLVFFFSGFETISTVLAFAGHELALNPDLQEKLHDEIVQVETELNGTPLTYDRFQKMKYLEMFVDEIRRWPPAQFTDREVTKHFSLELDNGHKIEFKVGDLVWLPIFAIHMDPKFYPNPTKINPERFSSENKTNFNQDAYLAFGSGLRSCIANRFALMEVKTIIYYLLKNFRIERCQKTSDPIVLLKAINLAAENGSWVRLCPRA